MVDQISPLLPVLRVGRYGNTAAQIGVTLSETAPGSIVQVAAWRGGEEATHAAIAKVTGAKLDAKPGSGAISKGFAAFGIAPGKFLVIDEQEGLEDRLLKAIPSQIGTVTDLSHGRCAIRVAGPRAEWLLAKFFAVDLSQVPLGFGLSTNHHDVFAQIQRTGADGFDIYVFRSFARSFWTALCHAAEEIGYEVR